MSMPDSRLSLLNLFEVEIDGTTHHLVCFLEPVLAGVRGIDGRAVLGEFTPGPDGGFDLGSFQVNPVFIEAFERYMNEEGPRSPELAREARNHPSGWIYLLDARHSEAPDIDAPADEMIGCFAVDESGQIVPGSFQYNRNHAWFHPTSGTSSILENRQFYDWMHPRSEATNG